MTVLDCGLIAKEYQAGDPVMMEFYSRCTLLLETDDNAPGRGRVFIQRPDGVRSTPSPWFGGPDDGAEWNEWTDFAWADGSEWPSRAEHDEVLAAMRVEWAKCQQCTHPYHADAACSQCGCLLPTERRPIGLADSAGGLT